MKVIKLSEEQKEAIKYDLVMLLYTFLFFGTTGSLAIGFILLISGVV